MDQAVGQLSNALSHVQSLDQTNPGFQSIVSGNSNSNLNSNSNPTLAEGLGLNSAETPLNPLNENTPAEDTGSSFGASSDASSISNLVASAANMADSIPAASGARESASGGGSSPSHRSRSSRSSRATSRARPSASNTRGGAPIAAPEEVVTT